MNVNNNNAIRPMTLPTALLYFGIPWAIVVFIVYGVMPAVAEQGVPLFFNFIVVYATVPMLLLIGASFVAYKVEGNEMSWSSIKTRFRLKKMDGKAWLWTIGLTLFMILTAGSLSFVTRWFLSFDFFVLPDYLPQPNSPTGPAIPKEIMGISLAGNWWWLSIVMLVSLTIATLGEELWWRGYILPRQELAHGKWTWIIHGIMWNLFHSFAPWNLLAILPGCLALSFVAHRLENTTPALLAHGFANGLLVVGVIIIGVAG